MRFTSLLATITIVTVAALGIVVQPAQALQCGDTIVTDTTLFMDLGPCPGVGLIIGASNVKLDLNRHRIIGSHRDAGVLIKYSVVDVTSGTTIKGPGRIEGFQFGIQFQPSHDTTIRDLTLVGNDFGIWGSNLTSDVRVLRNIVIGTNRQTVGILFGSATNINIQNNTLLGHAEAINLGMTDATVNGNLITQNETGITVDFIHTTSIRGNVITLNRKDAIRLGAFGPFPAAAATAKTASNPSSTVQGNTIYRNGGNGILLYGSVQFLMEQNIVSANSTNGISVIAEFGASGSSQVIGNRLSGNGTDLFWDGIGTGNCWRRNVYRTSSPQTLPECQ